MLTKTNFVKRNFKPFPTIRIYDLDGTIIDSSHRAKYENGKLDLDHWKENCTKENILADDLLPLYWQLVYDYKNGDIVVLNTARELGKWDWEYIHSMGIYYDYVISRPIGNTTADDVLKKAQCRQFFNLKQWKKLPKWFYDDNSKNLFALKQLGAIIVNARVWNSHLSNTKGA